MRSTEHGGFLASALVAVGWREELIGQDGEAPDRVTLCGRID